MYEPMRKQKTTWWWTGGGGRARTRNHVTAPHSGTLVTASHTGQFLVSPPPRCCVSYPVPSDLSALDPADCDQFILYGRISGWSHFIYNIVFKIRYICIHSFSSSDSVQHLMA